MTAAKAAAALMDATFAALEGGPLVQPKTFTPEPYSTPEKVARRIAWDTERLTVPLDVEVKRAPEQGAEVEVHDADSFFTPQRRERLRRFLEELVEDQMVERDAERRP